MMNRPKMSQRMFHWISCFQGRHYINYGWRNDGIKYTALAFEGFEGNYLSFWKEISCCKRKLPFVRADIDDTAGFRAHANSFYVLNCGHNTF